MKIINLLQTTFLNARNEKERLEIINYLLKILIDKVLHRLCQRINIENGIYYQNEMMMDM